MSRNLKYTLLWLAALLVLMPGCRPIVPAAPPMTPSSRANAGQSDVEFAKSTFAALVDGDSTVSSDIDWEHFKTSGEDVGAKYNSFSDEANHTAFRNAFITSYSKSFKDSGGTKDMLTNWTESRQDSSSATIIADTKSHKHLQVTLSKSGGSRRLVGLDITQ